MTIEPADFARAPIQSTANSGPLFTEKDFSWVHTGGATGSGSFLIVFVGAIDTSPGSKAEAVEATFAGTSTQMMTLAHELTGIGRAFPSAHIFTLTEPAFSGTLPNTSGTITVGMSGTVSNINAFSVVMSGVDTTSLGYLPGSFTDRTESNLTSTGTLSGSVSAAPGDLLVDCVIANAGLPDDHTIDSAQILNVRLALNAAGSAKMSISHKFSSTAEHTKGMQRSDITALEAVSEVKFATGMH